jgi:hypothetical protein
MWRGLSAPSQTFSQAFHGGPTSAIHPKTTSGSVIAMSALRLTGHSPAVVPGIYQLLNL